MSKEEVFRMVRHYRLSEAVSLAFKAFIRFALFYVHLTADVVSWLEESLCVRKVFKHFILILQIIDNGSVADRHL